MAVWKKIVGRDWSPDDFRHRVATLDWKAWKPQFIVLHNTAAPRLDQWHSVSGEQRMANLTAYYKGLKWPAGPHLFIADDGIWEFTPLTTPGVHAPSWNKVALGVELVGDYNTEAFNSGAGLQVHKRAVWALACLHGRLCLDSSTLRFHREDPLTDHDCPGRRVVKADVINQVHDLLLAFYGGRVKAWSDWKPTF